jgi:predicted dehydrogenase
MDGGLVNEFVEALESGRDPAVTGVDGLRAVEVVDAAYRSVRSGMPQAVTQNHP